MEEILRRLLTLPVTPAPIADVNAWWARHHQAVAGLDTSMYGPIHRAILAGFVMDRPGYAFASGYQEALRCLVPNVGTAKLALAATERGGVHPRAIETRLEPDGNGFRLRGHKEYITLGPHADEYLIIASEGVLDTGPEQPIMNRLVAVRVPCTRPGLVLERLPDTRFVPEIPHARLRLDNVRVEPHETLEGDGYTRYLKPFRTIEDCHVYAAVLSWILQVARRCQWPRQSVEELLVLLTSAMSLGPADPQSPAVHIGLAGLLGRARDLVEQCEPHWSLADQDTRARWMRDRPLLSVAGTARSRRREAAWNRLLALASIVC